MASLSNITLSVRANIQQFQKRLQVAEKKMARFGKKASQLGANMSQNISLPMALAGGAALKSASDFQDAVTEIEKVSSKETASKLSGQIREMAETIPMAQSEIAKLAADAARFGVQGSKNIQQFTTTVAKMSFVTDLSAQEAGRSLAKIAEQADVPMAQIDKLGSTIVRLGDSMATSQQEIVKAMSRGTIAARNFGLQGKTIAALSARINEVSESSERAGTRLRRVFQELQEPKKVEKVAEALGMTAEGFRQMRKDSPEQALLAVIKQIEKGGAAGKEMANIFATSSRAALRGLASDSGTLEEALAKASDEFSNATAMSEQFAAQKDTFSAKLQVAINKLRNTGIAIGREMMPHVLDLIKGLEGLVAGFQNLSSGTQGFIVKLGLFAGAAGPVIFAVGKLTSGVASLIPLIRSLNAAILANPYTALAGAIAAAGAALAMYMTRSKETTKQQTALQEATEQAQNQFAKSSSEAMSLFDQLKFLNKGSDQYAKVISKINSKYGKFLDNQLSEKSNLKEIKQARKL
jgi:TP901 family phage tail tape measure protein